MKSTSLRYFVLQVIAYLPASFVLWYLLDDFVAAPSFVVAKMSLNLWFPEVVDSIWLDQGKMWVRTAFGESNGNIMGAAVAGNQLAYPVDTRALSFSIPFFLALHFATPTPTPDSGARLSWSLLTLWLLLSIGLICTTLKNLMLGLGQHFMDQPGVPASDAIALSYQFSTIMVPTLAPVCLWALSLRSSPLLALFVDDKPAQDSDASI